MRQLVVALLLLLGSDPNARARIPAHRHHRSDPSVVAASHGALRAATLRNDVEIARPALLASEASLPDRRVRSTPAPTRASSSLCSCERTTDQAARPPPLHD